MADFSITISNRLQVFGSGPSTKWNALTWSSGKWGEGTNEIVQDVIKNISNSLSLSDDYTFGSSKTISNAIYPTFEMASEYLTDANGYYFVFVGGLSDAENQIITTYTEGSQASTSYTSATGGSTVWS